MSIDKDFEASEERREISIDQIFALSDTKVDDETRGKIRELTSRYGMFDRDVLDILYFAAGKDKLGEYIQKLERFLDESNQITEGYIASLYGELGINHGRKSI